MAELDELTYWRSFIDGSDNAFEQIYKLYANRLYAFGLKYHTDPELVKDCIHDLFVDLHRFRGNLSVHVKLKPYLFSSLRRLIFNKIKKEIHIEQVPHHEEFFFEWTSCSETVWIQKEEYRDLHLRIQQLLKSLPARQREVVYLKFNEELSYEEIANMMDISVATCRTLLYRAIKHIRERMEQIPVAQLLFILFGKKISAT